MSDNICATSFDEVGGFSADEPGQDDSCVHVAVRIRPNPDSTTPSYGNCLRLLSPEVDDDAFVVLPSASELSSIEPSTSVNKFQTIQVGENESSQNYTFDHVFPPSTCQGDLYSKCVNSLVNSCLEGYNATIFAYGQSGSGKTHTMIGNLGQQDDATGVIPRALEKIFNGLEQKAESQKLEILSPGPPDDDTTLPRSSSKPPYEYQVQVQFLELYGEEIHDLVDEDVINQTQSLDRETPIKRRGGQKTVRIAKRLRIRDGKVGEDAEVIGLSTVKVYSAEEALNSVRRGTALRRTEQTGLNSESSRSHAIFTLVIQQTERKVSVMETKESMEMKTSKIHFVDLAGSERIKSAKTKGKRMMEGININKGLFVLGNVISALGNKKNKTHIPYRDSKLTRLLKGSLGGNHKTLMIACVRDSDHEESINTLRYANRAKNIMNHAKVNIDPSSRVINLLRNQVAALASECLRLRQNSDDADADADCMFSSDFLNNFIRKTPLSPTRSSAGTLQVRPSTAPNKSIVSCCSTPTRPSTAPCTKNPTRLSTSPTKITGYFPDNFLKRSGSDSCLKNLIALPKGSLEKFAKTGQGNCFNICEKLADGNLTGCEQKDLFDDMRTHLRQTLRTENLSEIGSNQTHECNKIEKDSPLRHSFYETLKTLDMVAVAKTIEDDEGVVACEAEQIAVYDNMRTSLRTLLKVATPVNEGGGRGFKSNRTPPGANCIPSTLYECTSTSSTCTHAASENEHESSTISPNISIEDTLDDISIPAHDILGNAITDYKKGYQILKMKNSISMIDTKIKNHVNEQEYLESIVSKLKENSVESIEILRSVTLIVEQITMLNEERNSILGSKICRSMNRSSYMKNANTSALGSEIETYLLSDDASSLGENVSDLEARGKMGLGSKDAPIPSILDLNKSHSSNHSDDSVLKNSSRKYRKIILRYGAFIMRPFLPFVKKKDDTMPFPLRL